MRTSEPLAKNRDSSSHRDSQPRPEVVRTSPIDADYGQALLQQPVIPEFIEPLRSEAGRLLLTHLAPRIIAEPVLRDLLDWHDQLVARLTNSLLVQRYTAYRLVRDPLWRPDKAVTPGPAGAGAPRHHLDDYLANETSIDILGEDGPYPELARLVTCVRENWCHAAIEMLERVEAHRTIIAEIVCVAPTALPPLSGASFGISDPHHGGRSAAILSFGALRVVYKPRSLAAEAAFADTAQDVLTKSLGLASYQPRIVTLDGFGFMEFVEDKPCTDAEAVARSYKRYGGVIALAHAFGCCDLHHENIMVSGEFPVIVDAEPLFRARLALSDIGERRMEFERGLSIEGLDARESVLELGVLPMRLQPMLRKEADGPEEEYEIGALSPYLKDPRHDLLPCAMGSDELQIRSWPVIANRFPNLPVLDGRYCPPKEYIEDILSGFHAVHAHIQANREAFIRSGGLLDKYASVPVRLLARPTMDYTNLLRRSLASEVLDSALPRRAIIESDLGIASGMRLDAIKDLLLGEIESLLAADIPRFEMRADARDTKLRLHEAPLEAARSRMSKLDALDATLQGSAIREAIVARHENLAETMPRAVVAKEIEAQALRFVEAIVASSQKVGTRTRWVYASYLPGLGATMNHADTEALYEGGAGTAIIVAEGGRLADQPEWCARAAGLFDSLLAGETPQSIYRSGGLARGLGGLVYALIRVGEAADRGDLLVLAERLIAEHGETLATEPGLDELLYGRAGLLLATLALLKRRHSAKAEGTARLAAETLMDKATPYLGGFAWPLASQAAVSNVSHGNAGIAMALARWARVSGREDAARIARGALLADDTFWNKKESGWIDIRSAGTDPLQATNWGWCNGRSGALLARAAVSDALDEPLTGDRIHSALCAHSSDVLSELRPGLCCGTPGALDSLYVLDGRVDTSLLKKHKDTALRLVATKCLPSHFSTQMPSLFSGSGGLAYALLRAAHPDSVSSLLWFD